MMNPHRRGTHNLSHSVKFTGNMGWITPISCFDVVPGDNINHKVSAMIRTQPLLAPVMHLVDIDVHCYYSPNRLVWDDAEDFYSGGDDGMAVPVAPYMTAPSGSGYAVGSLADYLGFPTGVPNYKHSALPFRIYNLIFNTAYRDTQLQSEIPISYASGLDTTTPRNLLAPCWKRDYFTKCRPAPQLGPDVLLPLSGNAPVVSTGDIISLSATGGLSNVDLTAADTGGTNRLLMSGNTGTHTVKFGDSTGLEADLSDVQAVSVQELREANALQRFLEFNNIFGGRYIEQIMARFGVRIPDYRIQFPEYIGSANTRIQFSEVLQTAVTTDGDDEEGVGNMKGHGVSVLASNRYKRSIPEYGFVMMFMIVRPKTQYMQGLPRMFSRETKYDYLLPEFQDIGDQAVLNKELFAAHTTPDGIFGYTPQYEEYRTIPSRVAGEFKTTLDYWHMARHFSTSPALNSTFVTANPTDRIFPTSVQTADSLIVTVNHEIIARRPLRVKPDYRLM